MFSARSTDKLRIKVSMREGSLLLPVPAPLLGENIGRLCEFVGRRFEAVGVQPGELRIAELRTDDGFLLSTADAIVDALRDGDRLVAVDYASWARKEADLCQDTKLQIKRPDAIDDTNKAIYIGLNTRGAVFAQFVSDKTDRLELYDLEALRHFAKDGRILCAETGSSDAASSWKADVHFIVENGIVTGIEASVKSRSDPRPAIKRVSINVGRTVTFGDVEDVQDPADDYDPSTYTLPEQVVVGPQLVSDAVATPETIKIDNACAPNPVLQIRQTNAIEPDQSWERNGAYWNSLNMSFAILNKSEKVVLVSRVMVDYKAKDNEWKSLETLIGSRRGFYNYSWEHNGTTFRVEPMSSLDVAIQGRFEVRAPQFDRERRVHNSMPQPLELRITFEDSGDNKYVVNLQQINGQLDLVTRQKRDQYHGRVSVFWAQCDDTEWQARSSAQVFIPEDQTYLEVHTRSNQSTYLYPAALKKLAYQAVKEGTTEAEVTDLHYNEKCFDTHVYALVDPANTRVYALKFQLKSTTSSTTDYFLIPKLVA
eukprot:TRINITY_DN18497_c0_g1_i1.p1 TRINITY_DN18497_c0_g1~~TRINITY_DN18497_c0_g1_i1.p1  ORF type:complete len:562 (-),score=118.71 TRINITY_DN18497_c0_g1_i1:513-2129(-)